MAEARSPKRWEFSENLWFSSFQNIIITSKSVPVKLVKFSLGSRNICVVLVGNKIQLKTCTTALLVKHEKGVLLQIFLIVLYWESACSFNVKSSEFWSKWWPKGSFFTSREDIFLEVIFQFQLVLIHQLPITCPDCLDKLDSHLHECNVIVGRGCWKLWGKVTWGRSKSSSI